MTHPLDVIVIGSGFGGAVNACRAAQAGARVLVLERGRRWTRKTYPRAVTDPWLFDSEAPQKKNGWLDLRFFKGMTVAQAAGVGGGSLCYSSVVMEATQKDIEAGGWPSEITLSELRPYYQRAREMLSVQTLPASQLTPRFKLLKEGAEKTGRSDKFSSAPLAVSFNPEWNYGLENAVDLKHSKPFENRQGRKQGTCVHLGNCDIGCEAQAKNTLDLNYLAEADNHGAEIRPLHLVRSIVPENGGYRVHFERLESSNPGIGSEWASRVIIAAGSLGSTEILLRCRDEFGTLPKVGNALGANWSSNANVLTPATYSDAARVQQSIGPTISSVLDLSAEQADGRSLVVEDDGFPNLLLNAMNQRMGSSWLSPLGWSLRRHLSRGVGEKNPLGKVMIWLGAGCDASDGKLTLGRNWLAPWSKKLNLNWNVAKSESTIEAILKVHGELTSATGGELHIPLSWTWFRSLITVHPLGGCQMAPTAQNGVVDHKCEVFGYPGLFVCDGSVIPKAIGRNPSLTIAALAERAAQILWKDSPQKSLT